MEIKDSRKATLSSRNWCDAIDETREELLGNFAVYTMI